MMHHIFIVFMIRLRRELGYWDGYGGRPKVQLFDRMCDIREEIAKEVWPKFGRVSARVKKEQADRVRESASTLKSMMAYQLERFLKDLGGRLGVIEERLLFE